MSRGLIVGVWDLLVSLVYQDPPRVDRERRVGRESYRYACGVQQPTP
jgi:hypothetical protein